MFFSVVEAAGNYTEPAVSLLGKLKVAIIYPLMTLLIAVALLVFLWGAFLYVYRSDSDEGRDTGKRHMLFGVIGMVIIVSAFAILQIAAATFDIPVPSY